MPLVASDDWLLLRILMSFGIRTVRRRSGVKIQDGNHPANSSNGCEQTNWSMLCVDYSAMVHRLLVTQAVV